MNRAIRLFAAAATSFYPVAAFAQFVDSQEGSGPLISGLEGYWAGYTSCRDGTEIYALFLEVSRSDKGYQAVGKSFGGRSSYDRSYDLIETSNQKYVMVPVIDGGSVNDISVDADSFSGISRTSDCIIEMRKTDKIPY